MNDPWLTAAQAATRLGIKQDTLYAYVSRGLLTSRRRGEGRRGSLYSRAEVERLASRVRHGGRAGGLEVLVDSGLTLLDPEGSLYYRGWDVTEAAVSASYERVAEWLLTGSDGGEPTTWACPSEAVDVAMQCCAGLPDSAGLVDRMRVACAAVATTDPFRHDRRPDAVARVARSLITALVEVLPSLGPTGNTTLLLSGGERRKSPLAARLWSRVSARRASGRDLQILNMALVLLADHELAASTLAARIAASTWADPYLVVQSGLAVLGGPLHGAHSEAARAMLAEISGGSPAADSVGTLLKEESRVPGFGHAVYRHVDPRARALLEALEDSDPPPRKWAALNDVLLIASDRDLGFPNIDLAMAAVCLCLDLLPGAGEAIFAVARTAGWLAHAVEEYEHRLRFRPRAVYLGPDPRTHGGTSGE